MKIQSRVISHLRIFHDYFAGGNWKGMEIFPSPESAILLSNKRLRLYQEPSGCALVRDFLIFADDFPPPNLKEESFSIRLILQPSNSSFQHFTDLPQTDLLREVLYFSNRSLKGDHRQREEDNSTEGGAIAPIHLSSEEKISSKDVVKVMPKIFKFRPGPAPDKRVEVFQGGQLVQTAFTDQNGQVTIDVSAEPEGRFEAQVEGGGRKCFVTSVVAKKRHFGYVDIEISEQVYSGERINEFQIYFQAREVYWQYHVLPGDRLISTMKVEDPEKVITFEEAAVSEPIEQEQRTFISSVKIPVREFYPFAFKLVNGASILAERLPYPNLTYMKKHSKKEGDFLLESFLTLSKSSY